MKSFVPMACVALLVTSCFFKKDRDSSVSGELVSVSSTTNIQGNTEPVIEIVGQAPSGFSVSFDEEGFGSRIVGFKVKGLSNGSTYVFEVAQPGLLDSVISFPYSPSGVADLRIAAVPQGTMAAVYDDASGFSVAIDSSKGVVMGQLSVNGTGCNPVTSVELKTSAGASASAQGPYYFDSFGAMKNSGTFSDNECTYVFFNVPEGNYVIGARAGFSGVSDQADVVVLAGKVSFGIEQP